MRSLQNRAVQLVPKGLTCSFQAPHMAFLLLESPVSPFLLLPPAPGVGHPQGQGSLHLGGSGNLRGVWPKLGGGEEGSRVACSLVPSFGREAWCGIQT